jgi:copper chaperone CopZ
VREEVSKVTGVRDLTVDAANGDLTITSDLPVDDADVIRAVTEAGYSASRR